MNDFLTAIIPDPDFLDDECRKEIYGDTVKELSANVREWIVGKGYSASDIGAHFNVFRDGSLVACIAYNGRFVWRYLKGAS